MSTSAAYPVTLEIDYPHRELDRLTTLLRPVTIIPIAIVLGLVSGPTAHAGQEIVVEAGGVVFAATVLMLLFRRKYPRWWFDWNLALTKFGLRVAAYGMLLRDEYPSTDEEQAVHVQLAYPDASRELNRWMPLAKWFLAIPHYFVLAVLCLGAVFGVLGAWLAILFKGTYPRALFEYSVAHGLGRIPDGAGGSVTSCHTQ
jgi:hypothetical protein